MPNTKDLVIMALVVIAVMRVVQGSPDLYKLAYGVDRQ